MIRIYPEQLAAQLRKELRACYFVMGNEPLLLQESLDHIRAQATLQGFTEQYQFNLDTHTDWQAIFSLTQTMSLFSSRQLMTLTLSENGVNAAIGEQLIKLSTLLHADILLVLQGDKLSKAQENTAWFKVLSQYGVLIPCLAPDQAHLSGWVATRARQMQLTLDQAANQLLCYCYEGNLLALKQALERLSLLYPDGKLTLPRIEKAVNDAARFSPYHWIDAILASKSKRAWHILQQLQQEGIEPVILLRTLQREVILLLTLKEQWAHSQNLRELFDHHKVWQNRRPLFSHALQQLNLAQLHQAIKRLAHIELTLKQDYAESVWTELASLMLLLCGKTLPEIMLNAE